MRDRILERFAQASSAVLQQVGEAQQQRQTHALAAGALHDFAQHEPWPGVAHRRGDQQTVVIDIEKPLGPLRDGVTTAGVFD